MCKHIQLEN
jgi:exonuclease VII large subunit